MSTLAPVATSTESDNNDEEVMHIVCPDDENLALCGEDLTDSKWGVGPECSECELLERAL